MLNVLCTLSITSNTSIIVTHDLEPPNFLHLPPPLKDNPQSSQTHVEAICWEHIQILQSDQQCAIVIIICHVFEILASDVA